MGFLLRNLNPRRLFNPSYWKRLFLLFTAALFRRAMIAKDMNTSRLKGGEETIRRAKPIILCEPPDSELS